MPVAICISPVNAEEYCVPTNYTITYQLGGGCNGTAPSSVTVARGANFTTPNAATACGDNTVTKWKIDGTNDYITSNTTLPYVWTNDITLVAGATVVSLSAPYSVNTSIHGYQNDSRSAYGAESFNCTGCNDNEWHADFSYGTVTGIASCNSTPGDNQDMKWTNPTTASSDSMSSSSTGQYCWCKMTGFAGQSLSVAPWGFFYDYDSADSCAAGCASHVAAHPGFRGAVYNASGVINSEE